MSRLEDIPPYQPQTNEQENTIWISDDDSNSAASETPSVIDITEQTMQLRKSPPQNVETTSVSDSMIAWDFLEAHGWASQYDAPPRDNPQLRLNPFPSQDKMVIMGDASHANYLFRNDNCTLACHDPANNRRDFDPDEIYNPTNPLARKISYYERHEQAAIEGHDKLSPLEQVRRREAWFECTKARLKGVSDKAFTFFSLFYTKVEVSGLHALLNPSIVHIVKMYRISNIYVLAAFGTIGGALFGFDISSMSLWIGADQYLDYFNSPDSNLQGGITASMSAGSFAGAIAAGFLSDRIGRRRVLMVASCIWIIGAVVQCSAQNVAHLIVGRMISGFSIGITSSQVCVYLAELAPSRIRGRIVGIQQWAIEWGILIMYMVSYGCEQGISGPSSFRVAWGVQGVPGIVLFAAMIFFPESPRWLGSKGRWDEALDTLALLHGNGDRENPVVVAEYEEVQEAARIAAEAKGISFFSLFGRRLWKRTVCGASVQMWQQLLGGNVTMYYVVYVFQMAGLTGNTNLYSSAIQYVIFLVTTGFMLPIIDRIGRRHLLLTGSILCMGLHFAIAGLMASYGHYVSEIDGNKNLRWLITGAPSKGVIACSYIFVGVYGLTWAPTAWIYCSEVFPLKHRALGVGVSAATNWIFNFALAYFVSPAFTNIQWKTYIIFGVFCFVMTIHVWFMYPETQGRTLEEIDLVFETKGVPAWRSGGIGVHDFEERVQRAKALHDGSRSVDGNISTADKEGDKSAAHEEVV
ncbi:putative sugar transporter [Phaeomoniella chlamydospora]|uniref:Putative sugar transporter n=1 Tax=Phaeomoniella chlamydospora TaxID=158046 RepID=A0A0G2ERZ4_PHACM|nr:putative sugar transporter [Phaeomoniella chlamydospora]